jgi:RimJ/RimL family protein N-acetyltransferase
MTILEKIETKRLILRQVEDEDFEDFFRIIHNIDSLKFLNFIPKNKTYNSIKTLFDSVIESYNTSNPILFFFVKEKISDSFIGFCGLLPSRVNELKCIYGLLSQYRGNGYMIETLKKFFSYAFSKLSLTKIVAYIPVRNKRALNVAERAGMKYLGNISYKNSNKVMFFTINKTEYYKQTSY